MSISLATGDTQQFTAAMLDNFGNPLFGVGAPKWSSSNPSVASVNSVGVVSAVAQGSATITASLGGVTGTSVVSVIQPLVGTLDFAPLVRPFDLADPLILVSNTGRTGYQDGVPQHTASGILGLARASYPKSADAWGFVAPVDGPMSQDYIPNVSHVTSSVFVDGPYPNTAAVSMVPNDADQHFAELDMRWAALATADRQDVADFKISVACVLIGQTPADVGKTVRVNLIDQANAPGANWSGAVPVIKFVDVVLHHSLAEVDHTAATASLWEHVSLTFDNASQQAAVTLSPQLVVTMVPSSGNLVNYAVAPYMARAWQVEEAVPQNWYRPMPFHSTLGVQSTDIYCNAWSEDSDLPTLLGGAVRASTAIAAPDAGRYFSSRTLSQYTLGVGDGITTAALVRIEDGGNSPPTLSNTPTTGCWVPWYIEPATGHTLPLDTDLAAYLIASGMVTVDEDTVTRADNASSPGTMDTGQAWLVNTGVWGVVSNTLQLQTQVGEDYIYVDSAASDCTIDTTLFAVGSDGSVVFRITNASNLWRLLWEAGAMFLQKNVAGAGFNTVTSATVALSAGDRVGLSLSGNTISPTHNGTVIGALVATDSFNATATKHGLGAANNGPRYSHFKVTATSANAHTYGPVAMVRDGTRYGSALVRANGGQFFSARFNINQASEGYLDFTPKIVNASSGTLVFNAYRAGVIPEDSRDQGLRNAWVPKRTITGRQFGDSCFETIPNIATIMTTPTLFWLMRQVVPWSFGDLENLNGAGINGYHPSLWQSGPYGSADYTFNCDVQPFYDGTFTLGITVARGSPTVNPGSFMSWQMFINRMSIAQAAIAWPKMVAFDIAAAALNGVPLALGIGLGTGTSVQWLKNGDTFLGGTVAYTNTAGTAWAFDGGLGTGPGLGHLGIAADLDRVRQTNGWFQAIFAANSIGSDVPTIQAQATYQITRKWGPRLDYR